MTQAMKIIYFMGYTLLLYMYQIPVLCIIGGLNAMLI